MFRAFSNRLLDGPDDGLPAECYACSGTCARCGRDFNVQGELVAALQNILDLEPMAMREGIPADLYQEAMARARTALAKARGEA